LRFTTHATTGATALLLPAQNSHTFDTMHARVKCEHDERVDERVLCGVFD